MGYGLRNLGIYGTIFIETAFLAGKHGGEPMKKRKMLRLAALCLACVLLFSGCSLHLGEYADNFKQLVDWLTDDGAYGGLTFEEMTYTRPDMGEFQRILEYSCSIARKSEDLDLVVDAIWEFYDVYDSFYTNLNLANIHYSADMTDTYWQTENDYCMGFTSDADAGLDSLYYALAESPVREALEGDDYFGPGYFESYDGESIWDQEFLDLMNQESALINQYYDLSGRALEAQSSDDYYDTYGRELSQLFVELVGLRQEIAGHLGYDSYVPFAYDFYYSRDYAPEEAASYFEEIREKLVPLYTQVNSSRVWQGNWGDYTPEDSLAYVERTAKGLGGEIWETFREMRDRKLYDNAISRNKYDASFEVYLDSYRIPYIFLNPDGSPYDPLAFAHEFGHYCSDALCGGSYAGTDVAEVFSQGMEYLSLCCGDPDSQVAQLKLLDCLNVYVEQAAYASFEQQVYGLTGEDLTAENVQALYAQVGKDFGFESWEWDSRDYVTMPHFFTNPMYIVSYVVSNDAAFQLYQMEQAESGSGRDWYRKNLRSEERYFLTFVEDTGLESPFAPGRVDTVRQLLESRLED